jgi:hypothetical protein
MARRIRRQDGELWGAEGADSLWTGDDYEVAIVSKQTGRPAIEVRLAIMKVGQNRTRVIAELTGSTREASPGDPKTVQDRPCA